MDTLACITTVVPGNVTDPFAYGAVSHPLAHSLDGSNSLKAWDSGKLKGPIGTRADLDIMKIDLCCMLANKQHAGRWRRYLDRF